MVQQRSYKTFGYMVLNPTFLSKFHYQRFHHSFLKIIYRTFELCRIKKDNIEVTKIWQVYQIICHQMILL